MWREHATLSQELLPYLGHGWISVKPYIRRLDGHEVVFEYGSRKRFDAIIYNIAFPFLDKALFDPQADASALYRRMVSLKHPTLIFAGLVQPVGPTIPLVETQGRWLAALLSDEVSLPDAETQRREVAAHQKYQREIYLDTARYVLEVDSRTYTAQMLADMRSGKLPASTTASSVDIASSRSTISFPCSATGSSNLCQFFRRQNAPNFWHAEV
jgi:dimethylaniline monooxygenase (N-oxide forming)